MKSSSFPERRGLALLLVAAGLASGGVASLFGACGPFGDTAADAFCPFVLEVFYLGITTGTTVTTYDPASNVTRLQMAAFLSRSVDGVLKRGSRRAAMRQRILVPNIASGANSVSLWKAPDLAVIGNFSTGAGTTPVGAASDGINFWITLQGVSKLARF